LLDGVDGNNVITDFDKSQKIENPLFSIPLSSASHYTFI